MPWLALAGIGGGVASGAIGAITSSSAQNNALQQSQNAFQQYLNVAIPDTAEQQLALQKYQQTGQLDPRLQQAVQQAQSHMSGIQQDPSLRSAQLNALNSLQDISSRGGRSLQQDAYLNKLNNDVNSANAGRIGAIENQYAQRGMGQPGGMALVAQLQNAQNETQTQNDASMNAAAQAQQNALQALAQGGSQAGQMRSQDFSQQAQIAQAQDSIDRFNTSVLNQANQNNTQAQNSAQAYNTQVAQQIANANTNLSNQQQQYNKGLYQQNFNDQMAKAGGEANALNGVATQYNNIGKTNAGMWGGIGQGLALGGVAGQNWYNQSNNQNNNSGQNQNQNYSSTPNSEEDDIT